jgi:ribosomal protein L37AE/L43A
MIDDVRQLIIDLRGGIPEKCDFCHEDRPANEMHPEEAGMWVCIHCMNRWEKQDKEENKND